MARDRFPSDETRIKTKPFVRVHFSVANHRKTAAAWADLELRGMLVELWRIAGEKYANKTADEVILSRADVRSVATRERHAHNLTALRRLCASVGYTMREQGSSTIVRVRNFAKKNGVTPQTPRTTDSTPAESAASDADADSSSPKTPKKRAPRRRIAEAQKAESPITIEAVDGLPDAFFEALASDRPDLEASARGARAWLRSLVPKMREAGRVRLRATAAAWWMNATSAEIAIAVEREELVRARAQARASPRPIAPVVTSLPTSLFEHS